MKPGLQTCVQRKLCFALGLTLVALLGGCASFARQPAEIGLRRGATDVPHHFLVGAHDSDETSEPEDGRGARSPMVDPRDGTKLILERSEQGYGDYAVPAGKYGVAANELLRLNTSTGSALGIVKR